MSSRITLFPYILLLAMVLTSCLQPATDSGQDATPVAAPEVTVSVERISFIEPDLWCEFGGTGADIELDGRRMNFTCDEPDGRIVALVGDISLNDDGAWQIERADIIRTGTGFEVEASEMMLLTHIRLEDGTICAEAGHGATFGINGERVNFTCDQPDVVLAGDVVVGEEGWQVLKAGYISTEEGFEPTFTEMVSITEIGVTR